MIGCVQRSWLAALVPVATATVALSPRRPPALLRPAPRSPPPPQPAPSPPARPRPASANHSYLSLVDRLSQIGSKKSAGPQDPLQADVVDAAQRRATAGSLKELLQVDADVGRETREREREEDAEHIPQRQKMANRSCFYQLGQPDAAWQQAQPRALHP